MEEPSSGGVSNYVVACSTTTPRTPKLLKSRSKTRKSPSVSRVSNIPRTNTPRNQAVASSAYSRDPTTAAPPQTKQKNIPLSLGSFELENLLWLNEPLSILTLSAENDIFDVQTRSESSFLSTTRGAGRRAQQNRRGTLNELRDSGEQIEQAPNDDEIQREMGEAEDELHGETRWG